jgi:hypothetical protein
MKAVVRSRYGPPGVLRLMDVETPAPRDNEVLVKVRAVSLNASDWEALRGKPLYARIMGPFRPRYHILGPTSPGRLRRRAATRRSSSRARTCSPTSWVRWAGSRSTCACRRAPGLSEVPEALRYLGEGHAKGKVVVIVE